MGGIKKPSPEFLQPALASPLQPLRLPDEHMRGAFEIIEDEPKFVGAVPGIELGHGFSERRKYIRERLQPFGNRFNIDDAPVIRVFRPTDESRFLQAVDHVRDGTGGQPRKFGQLPCRRPSLPQHDVQTLVIRNVESQVFGDRLMKKHGLGGQSPGGIL